MSIRRLELLTGKAEPAQLVLEQAFLDAGVLVGRTHDAHLRVLSETASRRHCLIDEVEGRVILRDLTSANGTVLNGERITGPATLFDGDVIAIGEVQVRYVCGADAERATVVPAEGDDAIVAASVDPDSADPARDGANANAVRRLRMVCEGATACADAEDPREIPELMVALLRTAFDADRVTVSLVTAPKQTEVVAAHPAGARPPGSQTLRQRVIEAGEAVLIRDAHDIGEVGGRASMVRSRYRSTLAAPLKAGERILGLIAVEQEAADAFEEADLQAVAAAARQAALALRNLHRLSTARATVAHMARQQEGRTPDLIGASEPMIALRERIRKVAAADAPVLIVGETGTGKELVARHLHEQSERKDEPFVALNCAALVEGLLESELFGHEQGAFTGATERREGRLVQAGGGTLFLDEVGDLPATLQAKLLRVLSEHSFVRVGGQQPLEMRCRVVTATNRDLKAMVRDGAFREDLYYRLAVVTMEPPPLRERPGDVILLAETTIERLAARLGRRVPRLGDDARALLETHAWPGNVRELLNALERALVLLEGDTLKASDLPAEIRDRRGPQDGDAPAIPDEVITLREAEKRAVTSALRHTKGKKGAAAALLGTSWPTLNRKIREYGIDVHGLNTEADG